MTDKEKIAEILKAYTKKHNISASSVILEEYAEELVKQGAILPPCKVGQKVYYIFEGEIRELTVISLSYMFSETFKHFNLHTTNHRGAVLSYEIKDIGKTVFLTKEEAEEKLKELGK